MPAINFSGLASGIDSASLISSLVAAERASANGLTRRQTDLNTQKSIVGSLSSAVSALATAVRALDIDSEVRPQAVTVSDNKLAVAVSPTAPSGTYDLRVRQLAAAQVTQSDLFAANSAGIAGTGGLSITIGTTTKSVAWDTTDTLDSIAAKINGADAGVRAMVLPVDATNFRLVVTAKDTGLIGAPTFVETGTPLGFTNPANVKVPAADAIVAINGIDVTRPRNVIGDALPGTTLTLAAAHGATDPATQAVVSLDNKALAGKVKSVVDAYNAINAALHVQLDYTGTTKGANTLFGDAALRQLRGQLDTVLSNSYGGSNLGALGVQRDKTGAMTLDETKLAAAVARDPSAVSAVFVTGGFAAALAGLADQYAGAGGVLAAKSESITKRHASLQQQIDRINDGADALKTRLERQFAALETAVSTLRTQSGQLTAILGR